MVKVYRLINGELWTWESENDFIVMKRVIGDLEIDGEPAEMGKFAEKFIEDLIKNQKKIIINLG